VKAKFIKENLKKPESEEEFKDKLLGRISRKDKNLIDQAKKTHYTNSYLVDKMVDEADSEEAKEILKTISSYLYHKEEYMSGNL